MIDLIVKALLSSVEDHKPLFVKASDKMCHMFAIRTEDEAIPSFHSSEDLFRNTKGFKSDSPRQNIEVFLLLFAIQNEEP